MTQRIQKAINIFLDAINNGTLSKGDCSYCAVGNLCGNDGNWGLFFYTSFGVQIRNYNNKNCVSVKEAIKKSDFTDKELMKIEYAFETNTDIHHDTYECHSKEEIREDQIKGLTAVLNVMYTFDNCSPINEPIEEVFTKKAELIPV